MQTEFARKIVIIGGSAGGAGVAARLRRLNENAEILLIEKSRVISYATCGIPYFIGNVIKDGERMRAHSVEEFSQLLDIDIRVRNELVSIHRREQRLEIRDLKTGKVYHEAYDKLVLALGSRPNILDPKKRAKNVFSIRGYEETAVIKHFIHANSCRRAVIVGAGFIGVEVAENLARLGMQVCLIDKSERILQQWDAEMSSVVQRHLNDKKISLLLNESLAQTLEDGVVLESGKIVKSDITILAIGVKPNAGIAAKCGLNIGRHGGILVNSGLCSSDPNIYALGDVAEIKDNLAPTRAPLPFAGPAQKQARVVADNIAGNHSSYKQGQACCIIKVFNLTVAAIGANETQLKAEKIPYLKSYTESASNASFFPGAQSLVIKLLFQPQSGKILGAQIIGSAGVDKRIDVLATALHGNFSVRDLAEMELSYAPPYSSAKDPVNVAGMVACNQLYDEDYQVLHWHQVDEAIASGYTVIDVRTEDEFELRSLPGAINIPLEQLRDHIDELKKNRPILTYCGYGKKAYFALKTLKNLGFAKVYNLCGGLTVYSMAKIQGRETILKTNPALAENASTRAKTSRKSKAIEKSGNKRIHMQVSANSSMPTTPTAPTEANVLNYLKQEDGSEIDDIQLEIDQLDYLAVDQQVAMLEDEAIWESPTKHDDDESQQSQRLVENNELDFDELILDENVVLQDQDDYKLEVSYIEVDATGLTCPGPIMKLAKTMRSANLGDIVQITATDTGFAHDIHNWCQKKGHKLLEFDDSSSTIRAVLLKS